MNLPDQRLRSTPGRRPKVRWRRSSSRVPWTFGRRSREKVDWRRRRTPEAERFAALCSGSFFLASAGLLDRRRATTHWSVAGLLPHSFPMVRVDADAIFVQDGSLWTSTGVTAAIDLTLAFVEQDFGRDLALARDVVTYLKRPGGRPGSAPPGPAR
ncbi:DJ-1/PfpI family protein [Paenirhodobacter sp.]|uniref:DJ-1/PfpI family protein n=1 Tax=Paenirhodobacter sp. TaxID=1965326 RepID=UPI003B4043FA